MWVCEIGQVGCLMVQPKKTNVIVIRYNGRDNLRVELRSSNRVTEAQLYGVESVKSSEIAIAKIGIDP